MYESTGAVKIPCARKAPAVDIITVKLFEGYNDTLAPYLRYMFNH